MDPVSVEMLNPCRAGSRLRRFVKSRTLSLRSRQLSWNPDRQGRGVYQIGEV